MTPEQKYMQGLMGDDENAGIGYLPSVIDNIEDVKISLLPTEYRTVQKDGITLDGIGYYSDVLRHWIGKTDSERSKIKHKIKRDPLNIQKIYLTLTLLFYFSMQIDVLPVMKPKRISSRPVFQNDLQS